MDVEGGVLPPPPRVCRRVPVFQFSWPPPLEVCVPAPPESSASSTSVLGEGPPLSSGRCRGPLSPAARPVHSAPGRCPLCPLGGAHRRPAELTLPQHRQEKRVRPKLCSLWEWNRGCQKSNGLRLSQDQRVRCALRINVSLPRCVFTGPPFSGGFSPRPPPTPRHWQEVVPMGWRRRGPAGASRGPAPILRSPGQRALSSEPPSRPQGSAEARAPQQPGGDGPVLQVCVLGSPSGEPWSVALTALVAS